MCKTEKACFRGEVSRIEIAGYAQGGVGEHKGRLV